MAQYYTTIPHNRRMIRQFGRQMGYKAADAQEARAWQARVRGELRAISGIDTMCPCPPDAQEFERVAMDGYTRVKMAIHTEPDVRMPFFVLLPEGMQPGERRSAVIAPHGHASNGKDAVVGNAWTPGLEGTVRQHNYAYGVQLVRQGHIVFCPDARGFGERREVNQQGDGDEKLLGSSCYHLNMNAIPLGQSLTGMWVWDLMRLVDYVSDRPDVDPGRIGCAGLSGGGLQSLWLAALDERIQAAVVSGYFYGYEQSLLEIDCCCCNYVPHLFEKVDMGDFGALIAPRPLLIETGDEDGLNGRDNLDNVRPQVAIARQAYEALGAAEDFVHHVFPGPHKWCGERALPFLLSRR